MCIHFKIHHPYSLKSFGIQQVDADHYYFDDAETKKRVNEFVDGNLLPLNQILSDATRKMKLHIKISVTGTAIDLLNRYRPDGLDSLRELIRERRTTIGQNAYYNSLSEYFSLCEYKEQVQKHSLLIGEVFGKTVTQNICHDHRICSKLLFVDYADVKTESDFQNLQLAIEENKIDKDTFAQAGSWNKGYEKRLLQKLYGLEKITKHVNDATLLDDWRTLQDVLYYSADVGNDSHAYLKNILSDFEIVLIRNYLTKIKRKQRDISVIL